MKTKKRLFGRKTNRYFNYRTGTIKTNRNLASMFFVPVFVFMMISGGLLSFYIYDHRDDSVASSQIDQPTLNQQQDQTDTDVFGQKVYTATEDKQLKSAIESKLNELPSGITWSLAVRDLNSGRMANIDSSVSMPGLGVDNLFILEKLEQRLIPDWWTSWIYSRSVNDCVMDLVKDSDDVCRKEIGNYVGWDMINNGIHEDGFKDSNFNGQDSSRTTAKDINELLYRLQGSMMLTDKTRRMVFDGLYAHHQKSGIAKGCSQICLVANQTADHDSYKYDAAIVTHDSAQYVLVIMTKNAGWEDITNISKSIDLMMLP
jgi:hypothetical protein